MLYRWAEKATLFSTMRIRRLLARFVGTLYVLMGAANLFGLLIPEIREQVLFLGAVLFRYVGFVAVGVGLLMLQKWSAYLLALVIGVNSSLALTIYANQTHELTGFLSALPWIGPILIVVFFFYVWPVLKPSAQRGNSDVATEETV